MAGVPQTEVRNVLLSRLSADNYGLLGPWLEHLQVRQGFWISRSNEPIDFVYFPEAGLVSTTTSARSKQIEVGVIGREGVVGLAVVLGAGSCPNETSVQISGTVLRISADRFSQALAASGTMRATFLLYVQVMLVQAAHTAMANASCSLETRLARWLLMCHDRSDGDELLLTHEFLAMMLGVRRPGVTVATHVLEGEGMIRARRGRITVRDRAKLAVLAGDAYGVPEAEYDRLLGLAPRGRALPDAEGAAAPA